MQCGHRQQVMSRYRELLRLVHRLPDGSKRAAARAEAQTTMRQHQHEQDPEAQLNYLKELVARISFLRITTPRRPGESLAGGTYVLRDGQLVQGSGQEKGSRWVGWCKSAWELLVIRFQLLPQPSVLLSTTNQV